MLAEASAGVALMATVRSVGPIALNIHLRDAQILVRSGRLGRRSRGASWRGAVSSFTLTVQNVDRTLCKTSGRAR
mgnify:CR=1 FL=1